MLRPTKRWLVLAFILTLPVQLTACKEKAEDKSTSKAPIKNDAGGSAKTGKKIEVDPGPGVSKIDPAKRTRIYKLKNIILLAKGPKKLEESLAAATELVEIDPTNKEFLALKEKFNVALVQRTKLAQAAELTKDAKNVDLNTALVLCETALRLKSNSESHMACGEIRWKMARRDRRSGKLEKAKKQLTTAKFHFVQASRFDSSNAAAFYYLAEVLGELKAPVSERELLYRKAVDTRNRSLHCGLANGRLRILEGRLDKALGTFSRVPETVKRLKPSMMTAEISRDALLTSAELYRRRGDESKALASIENVLKQWRNDPDALTLRAHVRLNKNDNDAALGDINKALKLDKGNALALALRAQLKLLGGDREGALKDCETALKIDSQCYYPYRVRGELHLTAQPLARRRAAEDFQKAANYEPRIADNHYWLGRILQENDDREGALKAYSACLDLDANHWRAYCNRGMVYRLLLDYSKALRDVSRAIKLQPKNGQIYLERSKIRWVGLRKESIDYKDSQWNAVMSDLNSAIRLHPNLADAYGRRAFIFRRRKQFKESLSDYDRAIKCKPEDVYLWHGYRGLLYAEYSQFKEALEDFENYLSKATSTQQIYSRIQKERARVRRELEKR